MNHDTAKRIGYREQAIPCCSICKHASYGKNHCTKFRDRNFWNAAEDVCPTGVCNHFELRDAGQDEAIEGGEWQP